MGYAVQSIRLARPPNHSNLWGQEDKADATLPTRVELCDLMSLTWAVLTLAAAAFNPLGNKHPLCFSFRGKRHAPPLQRAKSTEAASIKHTTTHTAGSVAGRGDLPIRGHDCAVTAYLTGRRQNHRKQHLFLKTLELLNFIRNRAIGTQENESWILKKWHFLSKKNLWDTPDVKETQDKPEVRHRLFQNRKL